jgi:hypothetical protein
MNNDFTVEVGQAIQRAEELHKKLQQDAYRSDRFTKHNWAYALAKFNTPESFNQNGLKWHREQLKLLRTQTMYPGVVTAGAGVAALSVASFGLAIPILAMSGACAGAYAYFRKKNLDFIDGLAENFKEARQLAKTVNADAQDIALKKRTMGVDQEIPALEYYEKILGDIQTELGKHPVTTSKKSVVSALLEVNLSVDRSQQPRTVTPEPSVNPPTRPPRGID